MAGNDLQHRPRYPRDLDRWYDSREGQLAAHIERDWIERYLPPLRHRVIHYGPSRALRRAYEGMEDHILYLRDDEEPIPPNEHQAAQILVDEERWPLRDECCNAVVVAHMSETLPDCEAMFSEWCRVLAPEGRLLILSCGQSGLWGIKRWWLRQRQWRWWQYFQGGKQWEELCQSSGMELVKIQHACFWPYPDGRGGLKVGSLLETMAKIACPGLSSLTCYVFKKAESAWVPPRSAKLQADMGSQGGMWRQCDEGHKLSVQEEEERGA